MENKFKTCCSCKNELSIDNFNKKAASKDGMQNVCKACNAKIGRKHYIENTDKIKQRTVDRKERIKPLAKEIILYHLKKGCIDCGEKDPIVLEFDHQKDKVDSISRMMHYATSLDKLEFEISKCEVRCANCHRRKTAKDFNWWKVLYSDNET